MTMSCREAPVRFLLLALLLALPAGCATPNRPFRSVTEAINVSPNDLESADGRRRVGRSSLERHPAFTLAIVEFDDQGYFWDRRQVDTLEEEIRREANRPGVHGASIAVFVHGWQHTADVCDSNLCCFRESLRLAAEDQKTALAFSGTGREPVPLFGVYIGWRGRSKRGWPLNHLSFFSRKNAALKVGEGDMTEFLTRLDCLRNELIASGKGRSRLVIAGHSLGATVVYSAISGVLKSRFAEAQRTPGPSLGRANVIRGFGDLVVLLNPALDAVSFHPLWEMASRFTALSRTQAPVLVVVGSETDSATGSFFPIGQTIGTLFERTRDTEQRRALRTAVANYEPYVSHRLFAADPELGGLVPEPRVEACYCSLPYRRISRPEAIELMSMAEALERQDGAETGARTGPSWGEATCEPERVLGRTRLSCVKPVRRGFPIWVVRAAPEVLHEHNGFSILLGDFIRRLLLGGAIEPAIP